MSDDSDSVHPEELDFIEYISADDHHMTQFADGSLYDNLEEEWVTTPAEAEEHDLSPDWVDLDDED